MGKETQSFKTSKERLALSDPNSRFASPQRKSLNGNRNKSLIYNKNNNVRMS